MRAVRVALGCFSTWTMWRSCWMGWDTPGYKCEACLIPAGSWITSSTTARTVWTLSAAPQPRPSREASSTRSSKRYHKRILWGGLISVWWWDHQVTNLNTVYLLTCPVRYWGGVVPERCRQTHEGEEWNCFFGYRVFPSIKSELGVSFSNMKHAPIVHASPTYLNNTWHGVHITVLYV